MIVMIWFWHIYGAIASLLLALILKGVYILSKTDYKFSWVWDFIELKRLLAIGFPIIFGLIMITFFNSIDRFVIIKYLDTRQLGYYSLGLTISKFLLIIQTGAYGVLEPKVYRLYGEKGEIGPLKNIIWEPLYFMSLFFPVILGLVYVGSPYLLYLFLPKYLPSLVCMQIMILGSFFFIFVDGTYTFIVAINRQGFIIKVIAIGIAVNLVINYLLVRWGWGIEGVALGTTGVNMFIGLIYLVFTLNHFFKEFRQKIVMTIKLFSPFVLVGILVVFMDYFWPARGVLKQEIGMIVLKGFVLLVLSAPFLWTAKKKIKIFIGSGG
jgi:O-antigen/teichoic acid export membrane protein